MDDGKKRIGGSVDVVTGIGLWLGIGLKLGLGIGLGLGIRLRDGYTNKLQLNYRVSCWRHPQSAFYP